MSELLPDPEGPQMTSTSPFSTRSEIPLSTWNSPYHLWTSLISISDIDSSFLVDFHPGRPGAATRTADGSFPGIPFQHNRNSVNREAAIAPYSSLCYRFCTSFEPKPQEIVMALFTKEESLAYHEEPRPGKLEVLPVKPCFTQKDLSMAYSPGVANACLAIADDPSLANAYTGRGNLVAVVSNGTAVLGLGNIGPLAGKPVMEGKSVLFKAFADVNAYDINLALTDPDKIIEVVKALEPTFGGINLEDIKAPECFYIEEVLKKEMNIPVFHDDQHGTAIISGAGLINALEITGKKAEDFIVVVLRGRSGGHRLRQVLHRARHRSRHGQAPRRCRGPDGTEPEEHPGPSRRSRGGHRKRGQTTVFITNMTDFPLVNAEYSKVFAENPPARSCVAVKELPLGGLVEIEVLAVV